MIRHIPRFDEVDDKLEGVFKRVISSTDAYAKLLADYVIKIDQHVASITGLLSGNVEELSEMVGELAKVTRQARDVPRIR
ncbi:hypothetical protein CCP4SC76_380002 [Gammaproteobacteria bacterium]